VELDFFERDLLEYAHDLAGGDPATDITLPDAIAGRPVPEAALRRLTVGGLMRAGSHGTYRLTGDGVARVEALSREREDLPARMAELRICLLRWLYERYVEGSVPVSTNDFRTSRHGRAPEGAAPLTPGEISLAARYLQSNELIRGRHAWGGLELLRPALTDRGVAAVESGRSVAEFLRPESAERTSFHVRVGDNSQVAVGVQGPNNQSTGVGLSPEVLARLTHFAELAGQSAAGLDLEDEDRAELERLAAALRDEAAGAAPDRGRLRTFVSGMLDHLTAAGSAALGGLVVATGQQALQALAA
jgi:hypothetical protein